MSKVVQIHWIDLAIIIVYIVRILLIWVPSSRRQVGGADQRKSGNFSNPRHRWSNNNDNKFRRFRLQ